MVSIFSDATDPSVRTLKHMCEGLGRQVIDLREETAIANGRLAKLREEAEETKERIETLRTWLWDRNRYEAHAKLCGLLGRGE